MDQSIYSEKELKFNYCQLESSLNDASINEKLALLPKVEESSMTEKDKLWAKLFTCLIQKTPDVKVDDNKSSDPIEMDISDENLGEEPDVEEIASTSNDRASYEEFVTLVVEKCQEMSTKLKTGTANLPDNFTPLVEELDKLQESSLKTVVTNSWVGLSSDGAKMAFCIMFTFNAKLCKALCIHVLLPWMNERVPNKLEELSKILSREGDIVCQHLIAPLLQIEGSPLVKDVLSLEELLSAMSRKQFTTVLRVWINDGFELQQWNISPLSMILDNSNPSNEDLQYLINLVSGTGTIFAQNRDFGVLLVSLANSIKPGSDSIVSQMNAVVNNYKGSLKFKALKILSDLKD